MFIELKNESGETQENAFDDMNEAAKWCLEYPEYGITLYPEDDEQEWDYREWQALLDYYGS